MLSCYSFKPIQQADGTLINGTAEQSKHLTMGKVYRFEFRDGHNENLTVTLVDDTHMVVSNDAGYIRSIALSEVTNIKAAKVSWGKTVGIIIGIPLTMFLIILINFNS